LFPLGYNFVSFSPEIHRIHLVLGSNGTKRKPRRRLLSRSESLRPKRRFPPPWTVEKMESGFKVLDANGGR
jgi:hypothetical protein